MRDIFTIIVLSLGVILFGLPQSVCARAGTPPVDLLANWLMDHRGAVSGLPVSHVGDPRFTNGCFTYDAAVTALALIALDRPDEARRIVDFYISTPHAHRLDGIIEAVSVDPPYTGRDWSVRSGANLWLGLAAAHLFHATADTRYLSLAAHIADFAMAQQGRMDSPTTGGGIPLGPPGDPANPGDQHLGYDAGAPGFETIISTEATIDAFALFHLLQAAPGMERFRRGRERALHWLHSVAWNPVDRRFNRGFHGQPDRKVASDIHAWGISALGVARLETIQPGAAEALIDFVERHCMSSVEYVRPDGRTVSVRGVDFVDHAALPGLGRGPLVSPEWTFQLANAYRRLADDLGRLGDGAAARGYAEKRAALLEQLMAMATVRGNTAGFPYASLDDVPVGHEYRTPVAGNLSMIGVAYGILAWTGYDPLRLPGRR